MAALFGEGAARVAVAGRHRDRGREDSLNAMTARIGIELGFAVLNHTNMMAGFRLSGWIGLPPKTRGRRSPGWELVVAWWLMTVD